MKCRMSNFEALKFQNLLLIVVGARPPLPHLFFNGQSLIVLTRKRYNFFLVVGEGKTNLRSISLKKT